MRLTINEYCQKFKMSKEMINSKLRAKKLNYIIENGTTYIIVTNQPTNNSQESVHRKAVNKEQKKVPTAPKAKTTVATVLALYQRENQQLKDKIVQLESKIDKLIDDKEQMLRDEMQKIEQVYSAKDEQLKTILELVNTKLMIDNNHSNIHDIETIPNNTKAQEEIEEEPVELKEYIKTLDLKSYQRKIIRKRFLAVLDKDVRVLQKNEKIYLDFSKYDYSDLLEY